MSTSNGSDSSSSSSLHAPPRERQHASTSSISSLASTSTLSTSPSTAELEPYSATPQPLFPVTVFGPTSVPATSTSIYLSCSYDDFSTLTQLASHADLPVLHTVVSLPSGTHLYRFFNDDTQEFMVDESQPVMCADGNEYNVLQVPDYDADAVEDDGGAHAMHHGDEDDDDDDEDDEDDEDDDDEDDDDEDDHDDAKGLVNVEVEMDLDVPTRSRASSRAAGAAFIAGALSGTPAASATAASVAAALSSSTHDASTLSDAAASAALASAAAADGPATPGAGLLSLPVVSAGTTKSGRQTLSRSLAAILTQQALARNTAVPSSSTPVHAHAAGAAGAGAAGAAGAGAAGAADAAGACAAASSTSTGDGPSQCSTPKSGPSSDASFTGASASAAAGATSGALDGAPLLHDTSASAAPGAEIAWDKLRSTFVLTSAVKAFSGPRGHSKRLSQDIVLPSSSFASDFPSLSLNASYTGAAGRPSGLGLGADLNLSGASGAPLSPISPHAALPRSPSVTAMRRNSASDVSADDTAERAPEHIKSVKVTDESGESTVTTTKTAATTTAATTSSTTTTPTTTSPSPQPSDASAASAASAKAKRRKNRRARQKQQQEELRQFRQQQQQQVSAGGLKQHDIVMLQAEMNRRDQEWREAWIAHEVMSVQQREKEKEIMRSAFQTERQQWITRVRQVDRLKESMQAQLNQVQQELDELRAEKTLEVKKGAREVQTKKLADDLFQEDLQRLKSERDALLARVKDADAALDAKRREHDDVAQQLRQRVQEVELESERREREATRLREDLSRRDEEVQRLQVERERIAASAGAMSSEQAELMKREREERQSEIESLKAQLEAARNENASLVAERQSSKVTHETQRTALEGELASERTALEALRTRFADLQRDFDAQNERLKSEVLQRQRRIDELELDKEGAAAQLKLYAQQADRAQTEAQRERERANALQDQLGSRLQQIASTIGALKSNLHDLRLDSISRAAKAGVELGEASKFVVDSLTMHTELLADTMKKYKKELSLRRKYFNEVQELKGNIRVFCRFRPMFGTDDASAVSLAPGDVDATSFTLTTEAASTGKSKAWPFEFDRVFNFNSTQEQVFAETRDLIVSVMDGYNVCIFAYGQTGSGKTHTMAGTDEAPGVNVRALNELFRIKQERDADYEYTITVSFKEIYNETIRDLLNSSGQQKELKIRSSATGVYVENLVEWPVNNSQDVLNAMKVGMANRSVGRTNMNEHSSRSHSLLTVNVVGQHRVAGITYYGKLHLIDLAGSERLARTNATGERLKEAQAINKSLSSLGNVIEALQKRSAHVPYRDSKLTFLLQDALGGHAKTLLFVCCSPTVNDADETLCSLNFATRARQVELGSAVRSSDRSERGSISIAAMKSEGVDEEGAEGSAAPGASSSSSPGADQKSPPVSKVARPSTSSSSLSASASASSGLSTTVRKIGATSATSSSASASSIKKTAVIKPATLATSSSASASALRTPVKKVGSTSSSSAASK